MHYSPGRHCHYLYNHRSTRMCQAELQRSFRVRIKLIKFYNYKILFILTLNHFCPSLLNFFLPCLDSLYRKSSIVLLRENSLVFISGLWNRTNLQGHEPHVLPLHLPAYYSLLFLKFLRRIGFEPMQNVIRRIYSPLPLTTQPPSLHEKF